MEQVQLGMRGHHATSPSTPTGQGVTSSHATCCWVAPVPGLLVHLPAAWGVWGGCGHRDGTRMRQAGSSRWQVPLPLPQSHHLEGTATGTGTTMKEAL